MHTIKFMTIPLIVFIVAFFIGLVYANYDQSLIKDATIITPERYYSLDAGSDPQVALAVMKTPPIEDSLTRGLTNPSRTHRKMIWEDASGAKLVLEYDQNELESMLVTNRFKKRVLYVERQRNAERITTGPRGIASLGEILQGTLEPDNN